MVSDFIPLIHTPNTYTYGVADQGGGECQPHSRIPRPRCSPGAFRNARISSSLCSCAVIVLRGLKLKYSLQVGSVLRVRKQNAGHLDSLDQEIWSEVSVWDPGKRFGAEIIHMVLEICVILEVLIPFLHVRCAQFFVQYYCQ